MRGFSVMLLGLLAACAPARYTGRMLANVSTDIRSQSNPALDTVRIDTIVVLVENVSPLRQREAEDLIVAPLRTRGAPTTIAFASMVFVGSEADVDRLTLDLASRPTVALLVVRAGESGYDEYASRETTTTAECTNRDLNTGQCTRARASSRGGATIYKPYGGLFVRLLAPRSLRTLWMAEASAAGGGFASMGHVNDAMVRDLAARLCESIQCKR